MADDSERFACAGCGEQIGEGCAKNAAYFCDRTDGAWCGTCFDNTPCGQGRHGEGCPTTMICAAKTEEAT